MANTTTHSAPPNRAARPLPRIRPDVDIAPRLSLPLTQGHDATERSSTPLQTSYSPECVERLSEKGYEQHSERGFGRCREAKMGRKAPLRCSVSLHRRLLRPFSDSFCTGFLEVQS